MNKKSILTKGIAISLALYGLLSLSMPSIHSAGGIHLGLTGQVFYLVTGLGFLFAGALTHGWPVIGSLSAAALFAPQTLALDTVDFSYNFIGPIHVVFRYQMSEFLLLHINFFAIFCCAVLLLHAFLRGGERGRPSTCRE